jgi:hypothetical protein
MNPNQLVPPASLGKSERSDRSKKVSLQPARFREQGEGDLSLLSQYDVTEEDPEQPISTHPDLQYCGAACLAFGLTALKFGMQGARKI